MSVRDLKSQRSSLASLPYEIRSLIIDDVICASRNRPLPPSYANVTAGSDQVRCEANDLHYAAWSRGEAVLYEKSHRGWMSNVHGLLQSNKALRADTVRRLKRLARQPTYEEQQQQQQQQKPRYQLSHEADIMVVGKGQIWPTWLRIPYQTNVIDQLNISVRGFGSIVLQTMLLERKSGDLPCMGWLLMAFLERLCQVGFVPPNEQDSLRESLQGAHMNSTDDDGLDLGDGAKMKREVSGRDISPRRGMVIRNLAFNVLPVDLASAEGNGAACQEVEKSFTDRVREMALAPLDTARSRRRPTSIAPRLLSDHLIWQIGDMLLLGLATCFHRAEFFERIGTISLNFDSVPMHKWDLGRLLTHENTVNSLYFAATGRGTRSQSDDREWKTHIMRARKVLGLTTYDIAAEI